MPKQLPEFKALLALQEDLRYSGNALLLHCPCGAQYLCIDGPDRKEVGGRCEAWSASWWEVSVGKDCRLGAAPDRSRS